MRENWRVELGKDQFSNKTIVEVKCKSLNLQWKKGVEVGKLVVGSYFLTISHQLSMLGRYFNH